MGIHPNHRRNNSRYNYHRRDNNRNNRGNKPEEKQVDSGIICTLCNKSVNELHCAIAYGEKQEPAHFDCVLKTIAQTETLEANDRIYYLGNGNFGVITLRNTAGPIRFLIKKRIKYEAETPAWRKEMAVKIQETSNKVKN